MNESQKFDKYKRIKKQIAYTYKGYPIERILALDLIVQIYVERTYTVKSFFALIVKHTLPIYLRSLVLCELKINEPKKTLLSMGIYNRKDYYEIWDFVKSQVDFHIAFDFSKQKRKLRLNIGNIIRALRVVNKSQELSFLDKFRLGAQATYYFNIIDELEEVAPIVGKYCSFSSVHEHETILTCYFKKMGIPTFSLQHGLFTVFKENIPLDAILYENFISDYHFCWGQSTKDEFFEYGIENDSLIVGGYPRAIDRTGIPKSLDRKNCLVLLARYSYQDTNFRLIKILEEFSKKYDVSFNLKLHPSLLHNRSEYEQVASRNEWSIIPQETTLTELFKDSQFGWAIAVNTGAYYESYIYNTPCLRFNDGSFEDTIDVMADRFSVTGELISCLDSIPFDDQNRLTDYFNRVNERLTHTIGIDVNNYYLLNV